MSRQLPRSSAAQAAVAAVLVVGVLLLLIVSGNNKDAEDQDAASEERGSGVVEAQELAGGFTSIPSDEFFATVTAAQKAAGSWHVASASEVDGQAAAPSSQDVSIGESGPAVRTVIQTSDGPLVGVYADEKFYVKGLTGEAKPWWRTPASPEIDEMVAFADPERFLGGLQEPESFEVVGVEDVDGTAAVHYRVDVEASYDQADGAVGTQPVTMEMWVDDQDRPVQVITEFTVDGSTQTTTLLYTRYGEVSPVVAPPPSQVTTKGPKGVTP